MDVTAGIGQPCFTKMLLYIFAVLSVLVYIVYTVNICLQAWDPTHDGNMKLAMRNAV